LTFASSPIAMAFAPVDLLWMENAPAGSVAPADTGEAADGRATRMPGDDDETDDDDQQGPGGGAGRILELA
jgi:hypothetical protein